MNFEGDFVVYQGGLVGRNESVCVLQNECTVYRYRCSGKSSRFQTAGSLMYELNDWFDKIKKSNNGLNVFW